MADENKDSTRPISSGIEPGPSEHRRDETSQTAGSLLTAGTTTGSSTSAAGNVTAGTSGSTRDRLKESTAGVTSTAKQYADDMASRAKDKGRSMFEQQKETALGQVGNVAQAIRSTASNLQGEGQDQTARYVQMIADQLESLGGKLRGKDLDTLMDDAKNLARRSPGTFIAGSVVAGFLLARFFKSSSERQVRQRYLTDEDRDVISAAEAGPYTGKASTATRNVSADGTPATGASTSGLNTPNLGGSRL